MTTRIFLYIFCLVLLQTACSTSPQWVPLAFQKVDEANPILEADLTSRFLCPVRKDTVNWEEKDVFNPAAVVKDGKVWLIYRAEDSVGKYNGTSRIGIATSSDGMHFPDKRPTPVFYPDQDSVQYIEWEGGVEDPRVVEDESGRYIMTYTSYNGTVARLCVATSNDLLKWDKHGLAFGASQGGKYRQLWSKSGAIICRQEESRMVATSINGKYWMYWGDTDIFLASSKDLIHWDPVEKNPTALLSVFTPRPHFFDSQLIEPGPPAFLTENGILLIYNSRNRNDSLASPQFPAGTYAAGQILLDPHDPARVLKRTDTPFIWPEKPYELTGQVNQVCFVEGLVWFQDAWFLYYGTADSKIAVATSK